MVIRVLAADRDRADRAFGDVAVDLGVTVIEEAGQRRPALAAIGERLGHRRLGRQAAQRIVDGDTQVLDQRPAMVLPVSAAGSGRLPTYLGFAGVELCDPLEQVGGERRRAGGVVLEDLAPKMRPAGDFADPAAVIELVLSGIAIGLQQAGEGLELGLRMDATAIGREPVPDQCRAGGTRCAVIDDIGP